jgi:hypothetical protein
MLIIAKMGMVSYMILLTIIFVGLIVSSAWIHIQNLIEARSLD